MKYMLLVHSRAEDFDVRDAAPEDMAEMFEFMAKLNADLEASGEMLDGAGLAGPRDAKTVRKTDGGSIVTDGPFAEAKEVLGGYWVLDVVNEERVLEIAKYVVEEGGLESLEIRPFEPGA